MTTVQRVVKANDADTGWVVLDGSSQQVLTHTRTKREAVDAATRELSGGSGGGRLRVHFADGRLQSDSVITAQPQALHLSGAGAVDDPSVTNTARTIAQEGKHVNKALDAADIALVAIAAVSALINPNVQEAAGSGWMAFMFATFTWTVGCAAAVVVMRKGGRGCGPLILAVSLCYAGALGVAAVIGHGVLEITPQTGFGGLNWLASVVVSAIEAYGPGGVLLGVSVGSWLGFRASAHVDDNFLV
ncbi:hypothetical protein GCM10027020_12670 [Nocardioides salsibiostraticola]